MLGDEVPWDDEDDDPLREFVVEIGRLWHNYVASAVTVVDHMRKLFDKQPADLQSEYKQKIEELILPHDVVDFVHKSRQVAVHKGVFTPGATMRFQRGKQWYEVDCRTDILLNRYKDWWTAGARRYLVANSPRVNLTKVVEKYAEVVDAFYDWFTDRFYEYWFPVLSEFEALVAEYREISETLEPGGLPAHDPSDTFAHPQDRRKRSKPPPTRSHSKSRSKKGQRRKK